MLTQDELDVMDTTIFVEHFSRYILMSVWGNDGKLKRFNISERVQYL